MVVWWSVALGVGVWVALFLVPDDRLWLVTGPLLIAAGAGVMLVGVLVQTGVLAGRRIPWPFAALAFVAAAVPIYHGVRRMWKGWSEMRSDR